MEIGLKSLRVPFPPLTRALITSFKEKLRIRSDHLTNSFYIRICRIEFRMWTNVQNCKGNNNHAKKVMVKAHDGRFKIIEWVQLLLYPFLSQSYFAFCVRSALCNSNHDFADYNDSLLFRDMTAIIPVERDNRPYMYVENYLTMGILHKLSSVVCYI